VIEESFGSEGMIDHMQTQIRRQAERLNALEKQVAKMTALLPEDFDKCDAQINSINGATSELGLKVSQISDYLESQAIKETPPPPPPPPLFDPDQLNRLCTEGLPVHISSGL
jgi:hypothetical protein